jgi:2-iminobutanoate/2-iminopropanoate deaminase
MVEQVTTDGAPGGERLPFSQGIVHGDTVYVSGQVGIDPGTGEVVEGGIRAETRRTMENVAAILEAAGSSLENVIKATVFLDDMAEFESFNEVYAEFVEEPLPARSAVEVSDLAVDVAVEIEVIAAVEDG